MTDRQAEEQIGERWFTLTVWDDGYPMVEWRFRADDEAQAVEIVMKIANGAGFYLPPGAPTPTVDGPASIGYLHKPGQEAQITITEERPWPN